MSGDEKDKLKALLNYWVEHNREHSQEFEEWADKAKALGEAKVAEEMRQAAQAMERAGELLTQSLRRLEV